MSRLCNTAGPQDTWPKNGEVSLEDLGGKWQAKNKGGALTTKDLGQCPVGGVSVRALFCHLPIKD